MNYQLVKQVRENSPLRKSFIDLAVKTFDLSFEEWYQQGYWTDAYIPYAFVERNKVIANASANIIDLRWQGEPRRYIQIGTVMTEPDHRNKGLAGQLIHHILQDWQQEADAFFLFANPTTVDFTPNLASPAAKSINILCRFPREPVIFVNWIWTALTMSPCSAITMKNPTRSHRCGWSITLAC